MQPKNNIFRIWWFNFIVLPIISLAISFSVHLAPNTSNWSSSDESLLFWLIIICLAIISEAFILTFRKIKYRSNHYLYILLSSNLSLFIAFVFNRFDLITIDSLENSSIWWWVNNVLQMIFQVLLLFVIKFLVWQFLNFKQMGRMNKDAQFGKALERVKELEKENIELKKKLNPEIYVAPKKEKLSFFQKLQLRFKKDQNSQENNQ